MSTDPHVREIGRIVDEQGRIVVVGVSCGTVTLRTLHTRTSGAVELGVTQVEELAQLIVSATWQAAMYLGDLQGQPEAQAAAGEPAW
ncbi:MAG TPA: hypothetical protein VFQ68_09840 [Streptosporangiaceae bacterium]|nr:hypothetical protein [Streptosporangiaceae bacterium]